MTIGTFSDVALLPVGHPLKLADPMGVWTGEANVTGDASGGVIGHSFVVPTDAERRFVFTIDWVTMVTDTAVDPGNALIVVHQHHELANVTLDDERRAIVDTLLTAANFTAQFHLLTDWLSRHPIWWRRDFGGTQAERRLLQLVFGTNNNTQIIQPRAGGRFFDARILASPDFARLLPGGVTSR